MLLKNLSVIENHPEVIHKTVILLLNERILHNLVFRCLSKIFMILNGK